MITEEMTKTDFVTEILKRDMENIRKAQLNIATKNEYVEGKELKTRKRRGKTIADSNAGIVESLRNANYTIIATGSSFRIEADVLKKLRFYDMKHLGNWRIYNRQVWGILYNNALIDIKYRYGQKIRDVLGEALNDAFK